MDTSLTHTYPDVYGVYLYICAFSCACCKFLYIYRVAYGMKKIMFWAPSVKYTFKNEWWEEMPVCWSSLVHFISWSKAAFICWSADTHTHLWLSLLGMGKYAWPEEKLLHSLWMLLYLKSGDSESLYSKPCGKFWHFATSPKIPHGCFTKGGEPQQFCHLGKISGVSSAFHIELFHALLFEKIYLYLFNMWKHCLKVTGGRALWIVW